MPPLAILAFIWPPGVITELEPFSRAQRTCDKINNALSIVCGTYNSSIQEAEA